MNQADSFFKAYLAYFGNKAVFTKDIPKEMVLSGPDEDGWFCWKLLSGTLQKSDYSLLERQFKVELPLSFIDWHKQYFFLDGDCSLLRLPESNPNLPLQDIINNFKWRLNETLISNKFYPFGDEGNDTGPLVFDGRAATTNNEFAIRVYDHEFGGSLDGLSDVIFSSFSKLLECIIHYMTEIQTRRNFEIIPDFFEIDPTGAGTLGTDYWLTWAGMLRGNFEEFGD
jgi:hypothetical protein